MVEEKKFDIKNLVNNFLKKEGRQREIGTYYISDVPMCIRKVYYQYIKPKDVEVDVLGIFQSGIYAHNFLEIVLRNANIPFKEFRGEMPTRLLDSEEFTWRLHGRVDYFFIFEEDGEKVIAEAKSVKSLEFLRSPMRKHVEQLMLYLALENAKRGYLIYVNRNNYADVKQFEVRFDKEVCKKLIKRTKCLHNFLEAHKLPPPESKLNPDDEWECHYITKEREVKCPYYEECAKDWNG